MKLRTFVSYLALIQAIVATLSSLYLSEILHWKPCILCWYQRILMYPLVILIAVGILRKDKGLYWYILPLTILGAMIALYHHSLQMGWIPEGLAPCEFGISCKVRYAAWFGFITIPLLSFTAFSVISICMWLYRRSVSESRS